MKQYPAAFRDRLLRALDAGLARAEAARTFGVTDRTIRRWQRQRRATGSVAPRPRVGRRRHIDAAAEPALRAQVRADPDATLAEHCACWAAAPGVAVSMATLSRALARLGLPRKKTSLIASERDEAARAAWRDELAAIAPQCLVFLDETATPTTLTRLRARAPRGERAIGRVPHKRWHSVTLLASITTTGMGAALVLDGALARESFDAYVAQLLLPTLLPGQIVVLDNLSVHKSARARALIEGAGCQVCFLPSYSPDFNPIEPAFAKLKQTLRGAAERSFAGVVSATGPALEAVTAADARGFYAHCGYYLSGQLL